MFLKLHLTTLPRGPTGTIRSNRTSTTIKATRIQCDKLESVRRISTNVLHRLPVPGLPARPSTLHNRYNLASNRDCFGVFIGHNGGKLLSTTADDAGDSSSKQASAEDRFKSIVNEHKIVIFIKGVPDEPRCGFSNAVLQVLQVHGVSDFVSYNVLEDDEIREGIKKYTGWPTIPQVFFGGEFIGGCDVLIELHRSGDIVKELDKIGITSRIVP